MKLRLRLIMYVIIGLLTSCKTQLPHRNSDSEKDILTVKVDEELKTFYNLFPNVNEIKILRLPDKLNLNIDVEYYSREELLHYYNSESLRTYFDSIEYTYSIIDSARIRKQIEKGTFQKEHRNTFLTYVPYNAPDSMENKETVSKYLKNFNADGNFRKIVFYPFIKDYERLDAFKSRLQIELKFHLLDFFWYKILNKTHFNKVSDLELLADRAGFKIDLVWLVAQQILQEQTGEGLYIKTSERYDEIIDSLNQINRFDNSYFVEDQIFWVKVHDKKIYISPFLIRAAYLKSLLQYGKSFYDLAISDMIEFSYYADAVLPEVKDPNLVSSDLIVDLATFKRNFFSSFSFIVGHELAHAYLGNKSLLFQNEMVCDCYSYIYMHSYKDSLDIANGFYQNQYDFELGIYDGFMKKSVDEGLGDIWGMKDSVMVNSFLDRYFFITNLNNNEYDFTICDEISKNN